MAAADVSGKTGIPEMTYEPISAPGMCKNFKYAGGAA